jgi:hypothetical protein
LLSYPFDILKKRLQGQRALLLDGEITKMKYSTQPICRSNISMIKSIYKHEGITRGFYKGITLNLVKVEIHHQIRVPYLQARFGLSRTCCTGTWTTVMIFDRYRFFVISINVKANLEKSNYTPHSGWQASEQVLDGEQN